MIIKIKETDYPILLDIWESAVLNTHDFLKQEDFLFYKENLPTYFQYVTLYGLEKNSRLVGFIGVAENNIEMLFVHNDYRKEGIGRELIMYAIKNLQAYKVDVNEQNVQAVGFYQHMGFFVVKRSELDSEGKAYPILHMQLNKV